MKINVQNRKQTILVHSFIWVVIASLLCYIFDYRYPTTIAIMRGLTITLFLSGLFYFNTEVLIPKLLLAKRYWLYLASILVLVVILGFLLHTIEVLRFDDEILQTERHMARMERWYHNHPNTMPPHLQQMIIGRIVFTGLIMLGVLFVGTTWKMLRISEQRSKREALLKQENLETETKFLRSQINPHFLFNALNNVYSLSVIKSEKAPDAILKLSDLLRYNLYESNVDNVLLDKEIEYMRNFVDMQQLKSEEQQQVELHLNNEVAGGQVVPLLFIPFLENAFKHSRIEDVEKGWIKVELNNTKKALTFEVQNSVPEKQYTKDETGGIGLINVRRRLELLYPLRHELVAEQIENTYHIKLRIEHEG